MCRPQGTPVARRCLLPHPSLRYGTGLFSVALRAVRNPPIPALETRYGRGYFQTPFGLTTGKGRLSGAFQADNRSRRSQAPCGHTAYQRHAPGSYPPVFSGMAASSFRRSRMGSFCVQRSSQAPHREQALASAGLRPQCQWSRPTADSVLPWRIVQL